MRHFRGQSQPGQLLQISLSWWQQQAGVPGSLLHYPTHPMTHLPYTWLTSIRNFLRRIEGSLSIPDHNSSVPSPTRVSDTHIMSVLIELPKILPHELRAFNRIRLYLGVTLLSELTTADGKYLTYASWTGDRLRHSPLLWPCQGCPGVKSFQAWRRLLGRAFLRGRVPHINNKSPHFLIISHPLGTWLPGSRTLQSMWTTFYNWNEHHLYWQDEMDAHRFSTHSLVPHNRLRNPTFDVIPGPELVHLPTLLIPVDAVCHPDYIRITRIAHLAPTTPLPTPFNIPAIR
jgi:hypothetical protein